MNIDIKTLPTHEGFDVKYHAKNNPAALRRDTFRGCQLCGWSEHMAIHDKNNIGSMDGLWAHPYQP